MLPQNLGNGLCLFRGPVCNIDLLHILAGQLIGHYAGNSACAVEQRVCSGELCAAVQKSSHRAFSVHSCSMASVLIDSDGVDGMEQPGGLIHIVQQIHKISLVGHGGTQIVNSHQLAGLQKLRQLSFFYLAGKHDGVHIQKLKQLIVTAGGIGLANRVSHI